MVYTPKQEVRDRLGNNFTYHRPNDDQQDRYVRIRDQAHNYALLLVTNCPESRELSLALTHLEEVVMWANAAIARNEK